MKNVRKHFFRNLLMAIVLAATFSSSLSFIYWGYFPWRAAGSPLLGEITKVSGRLSFVATDAGDSLSNSNYGFINSTKCSKYACECSRGYRSAFCMEQEYYDCRFECAFGLIPEAALNRDAPALDIRMLKELISSVFGHQRSFIGKWYLAHALKLERHTQSLILVGLEHRASYDDDDQMLYTEIIIDTSKGAQAVILDKREFRYDNAGIEDIEWPQLFVIFFPLFLFLLLLAPKKR